MASLAHPDRAYDREAAVSTFIAILLLAAITIRIVLTNPVMNLFVDYTTEEGAIYEKIHFGTYILVLLCAIIPVLRPIRILPAEIAPFRALLVFVVLVGLISGALIASGRGGSAGYLIDSYITAGLAGLLLFTIPPPMRRAIGVWVLMLLALSALMGLFEVATRSRILPYDTGELDFRPTGLMGHPLNQGLMLAAGIGFAVASPLRVFWKVAFAVLFLLGTAGAGARTATIVAGMAVFACLILVPWKGVAPQREQTGKLMVLSFALIMALPVVGLLLGAGFLDRFSGGLIDESAMARLDVYKVFSYVGWRDIMLGTDIAYIQELVTNRIGLAYIESTPVILTFQLGLPGALFFTGLVIYLFAHLLRRNGRAAFIGTMAYFGIALSNNHLSTKMAAMTIIIVLLVAFMQPPSRDTRS